MITSEVRRFTTDFVRQMEAHQLTLQSSIGIEELATTPTVTINGREVVHFGSGNYLGLGDNPTAIEANIAGLRRYGLTSSGPRFTSGTQNPHLELEKTIAEYHQEEGAIFFFLVTVATSGVLTALLDNPWKGVMEDIGVSPLGGTREIFYDGYSHHSLVDACCLAVGKRALRHYRHLDMGHLEKKLSKSNAEVKLIVTDGLFSADGDLAPLPEIMELAEKYQALVLVDDAHGSGLLGPNGRGIGEHFGVRPDFYIGSTAKAFSGGLGGYVVCNREMEAFLRQSAGHQIFGGSVPPATALAITENIRTAQREPERREQVLENAAYLRLCLQELGYEVLGESSPIVPIVVGDSRRVLDLSAALLEAGFYVPPFRYPATEKHRGRLRVTLMASHTRQQLDSFVRALIKLCRPN